MAGSNAAHARFQWEAMSSMLANSFLLLVNQGLQERYALHKRYLLLRTVVSLQVVTGGRSVLINY